MKIIYLHFLTIIFSLLFIKCYDKNYVCVTDKDCFFGFKCNNGKCVILIDSETLDTIIYEHPPAITNSNTATFSFMCIGAERCTYECKIDNSDFEKCFPPVTYTNLIDGMHTFSVRAMGTAWNKDPSPATFIWIIDTIPPETYIKLGPENPNKYSFATFEFTSNEKDSIFECIIDDTNVVECSSPKIYSGLVEGIHKFVVRAKDKAGNYDYTPATYTWKINLGSWLPTSTIGPPEGKWGHRAVWTGSEMIIWGGMSFDQGDDYINIGSRYNPATDSWAPISDSGAPIARIGHTIVWSGTEMIVWGGGNSHQTNAGGKYSPSTDSWSPISINGAPNPRRDHTAVWTGTEMIIWGGEFWNGSQWDFLNSGGRYNPVNDSWLPTSLTNAPEGRCCHTAVWTGTEMIVWGGYPGGKNTGGRYNPNSDSWSPVSLTNAPTGRYSHTSVWTGSEMIVWGGTYPLVNTGGKYHPDSDTWETTSLDNAPTPRAGHSAIWTGNEMIIWGGWDGWYTNSGYKYNPVTDAWSIISSDGIPYERSDHTAVWTGTEMIIWGGILPVSVNNFNNTGGRYNPVTDTWSSTSIDGVPRGRRAHTAVWMGSKMIVWGGYNYSDLNTGGIYDLITDSWKTMSTNGAPSKRRWHSAIWTGNEMIIWGGFAISETPPYSNTGAKYNPVTDTWTLISSISAPSGRYEHSGIWTGSEMIVWGGYNGTSNLNTGGKYNPSTDSWLPTSLINAPSGRQEHTAIWTGSEMIVWGGLDISPTNTGGRYNPDTDSWGPVQIENAPTPRYGHQAVWTGTEMIIWGGIDSVDYFKPYTNTGGRYNPDTDSWTTISTEGDIPSGRINFTATWTGNEMIIWGGFDNEGNILNSGSRYIPLLNKWSLISQTGAPYPRIEHTAVWTGAEMIIWGGFGNNTYYSTGGRYTPP